MLTSWSSHPRYMLILWRASATIIIYRPLELPSRKSFLFIMSYSHSPTFHTQSTMNGHAIGQQPVRPPPDPFDEFWETFWDHHGTRILAIAFLIVSSTLVALVHKLVVFGLAHYNLSEFSGLEKPTTSLSTATTSSTQKASTFSSRHEFYEAPVSICNTSH